MSHMPSQTLLRPGAPSPATVSAGFDAFHRAEAVRLLGEVREALPEGETRARSTALRLHALLAGPDAVPMAVHRGGLAPWQERKVERAMRVGLAGPLRVGRLAHDVALSASHFTRAFRESFGRTPREHLAWLRIEHAQQLMRTTDASLIDIALDCGLSDQAHLSKTFRRLVGETPSSWRRRHRVGPAAPERAAQLTRAAN